MIKEQDTNEIKGIGILSDEVNARHDSNSAQYKILENDNRQIEPIAPNAPKKPKKNMMFPGNSEVASRNQSVDHGGVED